MAVHRNVGQQSGELAGRSGSAPRSCERPGRGPLEAAEELALDEIDAEVIDLLSLRPIDDEGSWHRFPAPAAGWWGWRTGSLGGEIAARVQEACFWYLDAPVGRVCSAEVPAPYPKHLETAALLQVADIARAVKAHPGEGNEFVHFALAVRQHVGRRARQMAGGPV